MPQFSVYKLRSDEPAEPATFVDTDERDVRSFGPVQGADFTATLYLAETPAHDPVWVSFLNQGFATVDQWPQVASAGALVIVQLTDPGTPSFAIPFGIGGRFLLRDDSYQRGFGLRASLNLIYPAGSEAAGRLRTMDTKRRERNFVRSRQQASAPTEVEEFNIDRLREMVGGVTGRPADYDRWGSRLGGTDAVHVTREDIDFSGLGRLCRELDAAHRRPDYRANFGWIDFVQPVTDPLLRQRLEEEVVARLRGDNIGEMGLAPPEVIDWNRVARFKLPYDRTVHRPEIELSHYLRQLDGRGELTGLDGPKLKQNKIKAIDGDGTQVHSWTVWRCLYGELSFGGPTYVLDEGDFFGVQRSYLDALNAELAEVPLSALPFPDADRGAHEDDYNLVAASALPDALLMDKATVVVPQRTTAVELCDVLTLDRKLIHVKRHLGSSDLSHLFAQGATAAELIEDDADFRQAAQAKVTERPGGPPFACFPAEGIDPRQFEVVYAVIADWRGRSLAEALPFFSKVNFRSTARGLKRRRFAVSFARIQTVV